MRENRLSGSEGGGAQAALPTPIISAENHTKGRRGSATIAAAAGAQANSAPTAVGGYGDFGPQAP